jgi:hypothetical protein
LTETPDEFQNTYDHEKGHLAMHIAHVVIWLGKMFT